MASILCGPSYIKVSKSPYIYIYMYINYIVEYSIMLHLSKSRVSFSFCSGSKNHFKRTPTWESCEGKVFFTMLRLVRLLLYARSLIRESFSFVVCSKRSYVP